jgi:FkbM family methyltransferase
MTNCIATLSRHWRTCSQLERLQDRFFYCYGRILRRTGLKLPGRRSTVHVRLRGERVPFHLRLGSTDWLVLEEIYLQGEYSLVREFVKSAQTIVDLGANAGFSLRYWQKLFPNARIIAMEPDPGNCVICRENINAAKLEGQVTLLQAGAAPQRSRARLVDGNGEWTYRVVEARPGEEAPVELLSLSEVLEAHATEQTIDLLKCDIEGAERQLFGQCESWIGRVATIAIELHPPYSVEDLMADLRRAGAHFVIAGKMREKTYPLVLLRQELNSER